jgi:hypothetical protein
LTFPSTGRPKRLISQGLSFVFVLASQKSASWKLKKPSRPIIDCPTFQMIKEADLQDPRAGLKRGSSGGIKVSF